MIILYMQTFKKVYEQHPYSQSCSLSLQYEHTFIFKTYLYIGISMTVKMVNIYRRINLFYITCDKSNHETPGTYAKYTVWQAPRL